MYGTIASYRSMACVFIAWLFTLHKVQVIPLKSGSIPYFSGTLAKVNLVPRLFLRGRKDPGRSWSRATQILGGKLKKHLGRGGRVLRLENYNLCA